MKTKSIKKYSLNEVKDRHIGKVGTREREEYEANLEIEIEKALKNEEVARNSSISVFYKKVASYMTNMQKLYIPFEEEKFISCVKACGPSIYNLDGEKVATSDYSELERVKQNYLVKKLGLSEEDNLDDIVNYAVEVLGKSNRNKYRAIFYYLCSQKAGKFPSQ